MAEEDHLEDVGAACRSHCSAPTGQAVVALTEGGAVERPRQREDCPAAKSQAFPYHRREMAYFY